MIESIDLLIKAINEVSWALVIIVVCSIIILLEYRK
jgi:hypothetical protein